MASPVSYWWPTANFYSSWESCELLKQQCLTKPVYVSISLAVYWKLLIQLSIYLYGKLEYWHESYLVLCYFQEHLLEYEFLSVSEDGTVKFKIKYNIAAIKRWVLAAKTKNFTYSDLHTMHHGPW